MNAPGVRCEVEIVQRSPRRIFPFLVSVRWKGLARYVVFFLRSQTCPSDISGRIQVLPENSRSREKNV